MNRINTSRQTIAARGRPCNYRPSGQIAAHVLNATIYDERIEQPVKGATALEEMHVGTIVLEAGQHFYFVASKFAHRYYVVTEDGQCSSYDERVCAACVALVQTYQIQHTERVNEEKMSRYLNAYEILAETKHIA